MANVLEIAVDEPDELLNPGAYGVGALIRIEASANGATGWAALSGTGATPTLVIVAADNLYTAYDPTGTSTTWYRTRYENVGATRTSSWSPSFQAETIAAYATVDDLREELRLPDDSRDNLLAGLLRDATDWIDAECGRDFLRHPQVSGTETRLFDLPAGDAAEILDDFVSVTLVEGAPYTGAGYTALAGTDWVLVEQRQAPYSRLLLADVTSYPTFFQGYRTVRVTGVFGFATVPRIVRRATLDIARELYQQSVGGRPVGLEFGRIPPSAETVKERYTRHTYEHV